MSLFVLFLASVSAGGLTELDCSARRLALKFAERAQPWRAPHADVHDALRLTALCGDVRPRKSERSRPQDSAPCEGQCFYVRASQPDGVRPFPPAAAGLEVRVFGTVAAALGAARRSAAARRSIVLESGIHFQNATLVFGPSDSGTTLTSASGGGRAWLSGAAPLPAGLAWSKWSERPGVYVADLSASATGRSIIARLPTPPSLNRAVAGAAPSRLTNARFPNADPETAQWGYASALRKNWSIESAAVDHWVKPSAGGAAPTYTFVDLSVAGNAAGAVKNNSAMSQYNTYTHGRGGVCDSVWDPAEPSYWCSNASAGGWAEVDAQAAAAGQLNLPVGMVFNVSDPRIAHFAQWKGAVDDAIVHAWHSQRWFTNSFTVARADLARYVNAEARDVVLVENCTAAATAEAVTTL